MEDLKCPNHIENARIAGERDNAVLATEPAVWRCKRAKCVLPAILMAAGSAKIAGAWAALILPGNRFLNPTANDPRWSMNPYRHFVICNLHFAIQ